MSKPKTKTKSDHTAIPVTMAPTEDTIEKAKARAALHPAINAATVIQAYQGTIMGKDVDMTEMVATLRATTNVVNDGDLSSLEAMLVSQATALQTMFTSLARRAMTQEYQRHTEAFMSLAFKAQAQSRATIATLVDLKYPRQATFIKQANVAHGPQQVNNGAGPAGGFPTKCAHAHGEEPKPDQPELLEQHHGERLDTGKTGTASGVDPHMATVGEVHRPKDTRRKSEGGAKR